MLVPTPTSPNPAIAVAVAARDIRPGKAGHQRKSSAVLVEPTTAFDGEEDLAPMKQCHNLRPLPDIRWTPIHPSIHPSALSTPAPPPTSISDAH